MNAPRRRAIARAARITVAAAAGAAIAVGLAFGAASLSLQPLPAHATGNRSGLDLLRQPVPDALPNAAQVRRGQYLVAAGDCLSCHLRKGGLPFAGGLALRTPFGVMFTSNITSDKDHGIGNWTPDQFYRAMHDGVDDEGKNLYPAFPYPWFRALGRDDDDAILAFLKTVPPVAETPPDHQLHFPFNLRLLVKGWNLLFLPSKPVDPQPQQSAEWNRGLFLVNGPGHCSGCHSPKNLFGADKGDRYLQSGALEYWVAPDLTGNPRAGLGSWTVDDIAEFLATGRNARAGAGGTMAEVISYSTALMSDEDRHAIAVYLKSLPPSPAAAVVAPDADAMKRGAQVYLDACTGCHLENGVGQPRWFPPLGGNAVVQQADPTGLQHIVLGGSRIGTSLQRPTPMTMPAFSWKLRDEEIADVITYVRNSWGNQATPVDAAQVAKTRKALGMTSTQLTDNSGDR